MTTTFVRVTTQLAAGSITAFTALITLFNINLFPMLEKFDDMSERVHNKIYEKLNKAMEFTMEMRDKALDKVNEKLYVSPKTGGKKKNRFSRKKVKKTLKNKNK